MLVSLGILAHQEQNVIGVLLSGLARQSLLRRPDLEVHIHVVANGCSDLTADTASRYLNGRAFALPSVTTKVHEIPTAGKANAWNHFVHKCVDPDSEYLFLLDADISFVDTSTLSDVLDSLVSHPSAVVAVDEPVKDVQLKSHKTFYDRCVLGLSRGTHDFKNAICGQLYCIRYSAVRNVWMPNGVIGEDGFLRAMILTDGLTQPEDTSKLLFVEGTRHIFETRRNLRNIFHHQTRLAIGTGLNVLLFVHLREKLKTIPQVEIYIHEMNQKEPDWINSIVTRDIAKKRYFVMYRGFLSRRSDYLKTLHFGNRLRKIPFFLFGSAVDLVTFVKANRLMRKGAARGYW